MNNKFQQWIKNHQKEEPFCPFFAAYCDISNYSQCETCDLLIKRYGDILDDCISEN